MSKQTRTMKESIRNVALLFAALGLFMSISITITLLGIYFAFQLLLKTHWLAAAAAAIVVFALFAASLTTALNYIEREIKKWS